MDAPKTFRLTISLNIEAADLRGAHMVAGTALAKLGFVGAKVDRLVRIPTPAHRDDSRSPQGRN